MDEQFMRRAIALAEKGVGRVNPNPLVGAVIVKNGVIIGEGYHEKYGELHAERNAFKNCKASPEGADMYVTLEPCCHYGKQPPCVDAVIENKIKRVFIGSDDPNPLVAGGGIKKLREHGIEVHTGILKDECDALNEIFFHYISTKTSYVMMKYAMTADGKIASRTGDSRWISNEKSRRITHEDRNRYAAIMVGIGTVLADDPSLTCRIENGNDPIRIICDSKMRLPLDSEIAKTANTVRTIVAAAMQNAEREKALNEKGIEVIYVPDQNGHVDLAELMRKLGEMQIDSVILEGGGELNFAALQSGIVNKVKVFTAPKIIGGTDAKTPVSGSGIELMKNAVKLKLRAVSPVDGDIMAEYDVIKE